MNFKDYVSKISKSLNDDYFLLIQVV